MSGLEGFALGAAPLAGGVLLGGMAGKGTDLRAVIKSELDLLERIPEDQVTRRAALEQLIAQHVDDLVVAIEKSRQLQQRTSYFTENWRDLVLFLTTVLFTVVAWHGDHHRPVWLPLFIAATLMSVVTAQYVLRGFLRHVRAAPHGDPPTRATAIPSATQDWSGIGDRTVTHTVVIACRIGGDQIYYGHQVTSGDLCDSWPPTATPSAPSKSLTGTRDSERGLRRISGRTARGDFTGWGGTSVLPHPTPAAETHAEAPHGATTHWWGKRLTALLSFLYDYDRRITPHKPAAMAVGPSTTTLALTRSQNFPAGPLRYALRPGRKRL